MSVYVDPLFKTGRTRQWPYDRACHLVADTPRELQEFAARLGLKRSWFQNGSLGGHYDLTPNKRRQAVRLGAVELTGPRISATFRRLRKQHTPPSGATR